MGVEKKGSVLQNISWKFAERISAQIVTTIVSVILARLLAPEDYGLISVVSIFITLANAFVSDGLGTALIQKKNADILDYSSVLYINIVFSVMLYLLLYISAPYIARFYGKNDTLLIQVLRVLGLRIVLAAINSVQYAYVAKNMLFQKMFYAAFIGTVLSAIAGILMAYKGFGVWALVGQYLTNSIVSTIAITLCLRVRPVLRFSLLRVRELLGFGINILMTNLIITLFEDLRALVIAKGYTAADLAYFDKGKQFPGLIITNINASISAVLFPKMANEQDSATQVKETMRKSIRFSSYVMCPVMIGFASVAEPFVVLLLTEKWMPVVRYIQIFCLYYLLQPIHSANMQAIKAVGRGDIYIKNEIIKKMIEFAALIVTAKMGVEAMAAGMAVCATCFVFINAYPNKQLVGYSITEQLLDIAPPLIMAGIMCAVVVSLGMLQLQPLAMLVIQIGVGAVTYLGLSAITDNKEYRWLLGLIQSRIGFRGIL